MTDPSPRTVGATVRRTTARILPVDEHDRVLLMHGWDPRQPERTFWFTVGGAVEDGEDLATAGLRELAEEVGIIAELSELTTPLATFDNTFSWDGRLVQQTETYFALRVRDVTVSLAGLDAMEQATTDRADWWTADDLDDDGTAANDHLAAMIRTAVAAVAAVRDR